MKNQDVRIKCDNCDKVAVNIVSDEACVGVTEDNFLSFEPIGSGRHGCADHPVEAQTYIKLPQDMDTLTAMGVLLPSLA